MTSMQAIPRAFAVAAPITGSFDLRCPHCNKLLVSFGKDGCVPEGSDPWLFDSDAIPGATASQAGFPNEEGTLAFLSIGTCTACTNSYAMVEVAMLHGDFELMCDMQAGSPPFDDDSVVSHFMEVTCVDAAAGWLLITKDTVAGPVHEHLHGPFALNGKSLSQIVGPTGVSACGAINDVESPWVWAKRYALKHWASMRGLHPVLGATRQGQASDRLA